MNRAKTAVKAEHTRILALVDRLQEHYAHAKCSLDFENPFQLLVATILSAQCTDARVNQVTPALFKAYPDAARLAAAPLGKVEELIRSTGFFRSKAKSLTEMAKDLVNRFSGEIPRSIEELVRLRGVGRKTANVVLGNAFGIPAGVVVDTHVKRLSFRLGLTKEKDPVKIERDLSAKFDAKYWTELPHWLIHHGRSICVARKPRCSKCFLVDLCPQKGLGK